MVTSIVLDALLVLIILMMVPLGFFRGGLRELCTSAGILLGILMANEWSGKWAEGLTRWTDMSDGASRFAVSVAIVVVVAMIVGYGGSAAFSWKPGPGGRMYGAYLALLNAMIFIGFLVNTYIEQIYNGDTPDTIERGYVSRAVSVGFEWVLLIGTVGVLFATLFGMFVRERGSEEEATLAPTAEEMYRIRYEEPRPQVRPLNDPEEQQTQQLPSQPVRIREVRHWEEEPRERPPAATYGSGWRQTWPDDAQRTMPGHPASPPTQRPPEPRRPESSRGQRDVLRDWMRSEKDRGNDE